MVYEKHRSRRNFDVVEDAEHIDLYDRTDRIPFDKLERFSERIVKGRKCMSKEFWFYRPAPVSAEIRDTGGCIYKRRRGGRS